MLRRVLHAGTVDEPPTDDDVLSIDEDETPNTSQTTELSATLLHEWQHKHAPDEKASTLEDVMAEVQRLEEQGRLVEASTIMVNHLRMQGANAKKGGAAITIHQRRSSKCSISCS